MQNEQHKVRNSLNVNTFPKKYETNTQPSMTVPDQTMSIREIVQRFTRGLPLEQRTPIYEYDEGQEFDYLPDPRLLDISERMELQQQIREELEEIKKNRFKSQTTTLSNIPEQEA